MGRCTTFQKTIKAREAAMAAQPRQEERTVHVFPISHAFDSLDAGDRRSVWGFTAPVSGSILEPAVSCGECTGDVVLEATHNGAVVATVPLGKHPSVKGRGAFSVQQGDRMELFVQGSGNAKDVLISLVLREA